MLRWGLIAPGRIARRFADAFAVLPEQRLHRVAGRDFAKAQAFAAEWGGVALPSIEALCADPEVDIVYIASPHSHHFEQAAMALRAGKPVLCEKSLTPDQASAAALFELARERRLFLMEAVWSRFLPAWTRVRQLLEQEAIGRVQRVQSSFCFAPGYDPASRLFNPQLAGGALLDIGIYNLNLTAWVMRLAGQGPLSHWDIEGELAPTGVEQRVEGRLRFAGGASAGFVCRLEGQSSNALLIEGSEGWIELPDGFWHTQRVRWQRGGQPLQDEAHAFRRNGFEEEMTACAEALQKGWLEHPQMPQADTLETLGLIDAMRQQLGAS
jgi:predicted dehydrogenase